MQPLKIIMNSLRNLGADFLAQLPQIVFGLIILLVTWIVAKILDKVFRRVFTRLRLRASLSELFRRLIYITVWVIGLMVAAITVFPTLTPAKILTAIGLGLIAIGFAFKDIFENFLAGMLILLREPFELGDFIESGGLEGFVKEITIRDTHIRQVDGQRVVIPNAQLFKSPVTVRTDLDRRRVTIRCGVAYREDVDTAREIIYKAVKGLETVDTDKDVQIFAQAFGASSIDFEVSWWTGSQPVEIRASRDKVVAALMLSERASYVNGCNWRVDGGSVMTAYG